jgi:hypothetical protein
MIALSTFMATTVHAQNAHFISADAEGPNAAGNLRVDFKIAGLGDTVTTTVTASADAKVIYACRNRGQKCPNAANKQEVNDRVTAEGQFTSGKNGQITNSLTLTPPPATLDCPGGQELVLVHVTYSNVLVEAADATEDISGSFSRTFVSGECAEQFGLSPALTEAPAPGTHTLKVTKGRGSGHYVAGDLVKVTADAPPPGKKFVEWSCDGPQILANRFLSTTTATMPSMDVEVCATYSDVSE